MAFDAFLNFVTGGVAEKIIGESTDTQFKGWFEIKEFSFGIENTLNITSASSGAGAGKAEFKEFTIKKQTDQASPRLAITCGQGGHYELVQLRLRKSGAKSSGGAGDVYLAFDFKTVAVKSIEWSGSGGDDVPEETVIFEYGAMKVAYKPQNKDGTLGGVVERSWNKLTNSQNFDS
jgi:type VI secretion system secreted protein Hcp